MLSTKAFTDAIGKLEVEFENKSFNMTKERASQWYSYMKDIPEEEFNKRIDYVLKNCTYAPTMADIFKADVNNNSTGINSAAYEPFRFDDMEEMSNGKR